VGLPEIEPVVSPYPSQLLLHDNKRERITATKERPNVVGTYVSNTLNIKVDAVLVPDGRERPPGYLT
jgi:hypothetical protein